MDCRRIRNDKAVVVKEKSVFRFHAPGLPGLAFSSLKIQIWPFLNLLAVKFLRIYPSSWLKSIEVSTVKIQNFSFLKNRVWHFQLTTLFSTAIIMREGCSTERKRVCIYTARRIAVD